MANTATKRASEGNELHEFVVTTLVGGKGASEGLTILDSNVWHCDTPMGLGRPFRWILERTESGIRVRKMGSPKDQVVEHPIQDIPLADLFREVPIELEGDGAAKTQQRIFIRVHPVMDLKTIAEEAASGSWRPQAIPSDVPSQTGDDKALKLASGVISGLCILAWIATLLIPTPKPNPQELIPPQFAKVLLSPALKAQSNTQARAAAGRKGAENNVVQAFASEEVQKTTKTLLNVNAAKALLSKSKLLDTVASKAVVKNVFEGKSTLKKIEKLDVKALDLKTAKVDLMGGKGGGKGSGAASYGRSTGAALSGQGNAMVAVETEAVGVDEGLTKDEVGKVIREHLSEVRYCYESAMVRNPGLEGKLVVAFSISRTGAVKTTKTKDSSGDVGLDNCILSRLAKWQFPKPRGGTDVGVSYPFIFKSLGN